MTLSQERLRAEAAARIRTARPDLAERLDLRTVEGLGAAQEAISATDPAEQVRAVAVLRRFDLAEWLGSACEFAYGLTPGDAARWRGAFTRTVFLAGNPANLTERFAFDHLTADRAVGWLGPAVGGQSTALCRLLKLFDSRAALRVRPPTTVTVLAGHDPGRREPTRHDLHLAVAGVGLGEALVHLNHLVAEAVLDGVIGPGDRLTLRQAPWLLELPGTVAALRVAALPDQPTRLRPYAALTPT